MAVHTKVIFLILFSVVFAFSDVVATIEMKISEYQNEPANNNFFQCGATVAITPKENAVLYLTFKSTLYVNIFWCFIGKREVPILTKDRFNFEANIRAVDGSEGDLNCHFLTLRDISIDDTDFIVYDGHTYKEIVCAVKIKFNYSPKISINDSKGLFETTSPSGSYEGTVGELIEIKCINMETEGTLHWEHCYDHENKTDNICGTSKSTGPEINQYTLINERLADTELHCVYTNIRGQTQRTGFIFKINKKELNIGLICGVLAAVVASLMAAVAVFRLFRRPAAPRPQLPIPESEYAVPYNYDYK